jgi:hypothetical protein
MDDVFQEQKILEPFTEEQKKTYKKIGIQVNKCNNVLKASLNEMEKEDKKEGLMTTDH